MPLRRPPAETLAKQRAPRQRPVPPPRRGHGPGGEGQRGTGSYLLGRASGGGWRGGLRPALGGTRSARAEGSGLPPHRRVVVSPPQSTPVVVVVPQRGAPGVVVLLPRDVPGVVVLCRNRDGDAGSIECGRTQLSPQWLLPRQLHLVLQRHLSWDVGSGGLGVIHTESLNQSGSKRPLARKITESNV